MNYLEGTQPSIELSNALNALTEGNYIRRQSWPEGEYVYRKELPQPEKMDVSGSEMNSDASDKEEVYVRTVSHKQFRRTANGDIPWTLDDSDMDATDWISIDANLNSIVAKKVEELMANIHEYFHSQDIQMTIQVDAIQRGISTFQTQFGTIKLVETVVTSTEDKQAGR